MKRSHRWSQVLIVVVATILGNHYVVGGSWVESLAIALLASPVYALFFLNVAASSPSK